MIGVTQLTPNGSRASWAGVRKKPGKAAYAKPSNGTAQILSGLNARAAAPIASSTLSNTESRSALDENHDFRRRRPRRACGCQTLHSSKRARHRVGPPKPRHL